MQEPSSSIKINSNIHGSKSHGWTLSADGDMKWSIAFATGDDTIDEQHKMLFKASDDFRLALDHGQGERVYHLLLEFLGNYARMHFGHEETCMARHRCPAATQNAVAHTQFLHRFDHFQQRHADAGFVAGDARELIDFLDKWLAGHIGAIDVQLKDCAGAGD